MKKKRFQLKKKTIKNVTENGRNKLICMFALFLALFAGLWAEMSTPTATAASDIETDTENMYENVATESNALLTMSLESSAVDTRTIDGTTYYDISDLAVLKWTYSDAMYEDGVFSLTINVNFSNIPKSTVQDYGYSYYLNLPDDVVLSEDLLETTYIGKNGTIDAYQYIFHVDEEGNYYAEIIWMESFVDSIVDGGTMAGYISFYSDGWSLSNDGTKIEITHEGEVIITVPAEEIEHDDNETWTQDVTVTKTGNSYDKVNSSITYTVKVFSKKGTGSEITLEDVLSYDTSVFGENVSIAVDSVLYYSEAQLISFGTTSQISQSGTSTEIQDYSVAINNNSMTMILPALNGNTSSDYGDCYVITYTAIFTSPYICIKDYVKNTATVSATDEVGTILSEVSYAISVSIDPLDKSCTTETIGTNNISATWKITVNPYYADIAGYYIEDTAFSNATDFTVTYRESDGSTGTAVEGTDYTISGNILKFLEIAETTENHRYYTISYNNTTSDAVEIYILGNPGTGYISNTAYLYDKSGSEACHDSSSYSYSPGASISKSRTNVSEIDAETDTRVLTWNVSTSANGVKAGAVLIDAFDKKNHNSASGNYTYKYQWYTYDQIMDLFDTLVENGIVFDGENGGTITPDSFILSALPCLKEGSYTYSDSDWVVYSDMDETTYSDTKFIAFMITFMDASSYKGTWTMEYSSTIDTSIVSASYTYYNYLNLDSSASYTEYKTVVKYGYIGTSLTSSNNSTATTTEGEIRWQVRVYIPYGMESGSITVTDTLPAGISFTSATIQKSVSSSSSSFTEIATAEMSGDDMQFSGTGAGYISGEVKSGSDNTEVVLTIESSAFSDVISRSAGGYVVIDYVCKIDVFDDVVDSLDPGATYTFDSYTNTVSVTHNGSVYGSDTQTQSATYTKPDIDPLTKSYTLDENNNRVYYSVLINPGAFELNSGEPLEVKDSLSFYCSSNVNFDCYLVPGSVNFYQLFELDPTGSEGTVTGYTYVDDDGDIITVSLSDENIYCYTDDDGSEILFYKQKAEMSYSYSVTSSTLWFICNTITVTIPDAASYLLEYAYDLYVDSSIFTALVQNSVSLTGETQYDESVYFNYNYNISGTSAGASANGVTVVKTDSEDTSQTLAGAVFQLYQYGDDGWEASVDDDGNPVTFTTALNGTFFLSAVYTDTHGDEQYYSWYAANTAYYLVEIVSPDGYDLDMDSKIYFYWADDAVSDESYPSNWSSYGAYDLALYSRTLYVGNDKTPTISVDVEKKWVDAQGTEIPASDLSNASVTVDLYRTAEEKTTFGTLYIWCYLASMDDFVSLRIPLDTEITIQLDFGEPIMWDYSFYGSVTDLTPIYFYISYTAYLGGEGYYDYLCDNPVTVTLNSTSEYSGYTLGWEAFDEDWEYWVECPEITVTYTYGGVDYTCVYTSADGWTITSSGELITEELLMEGIVLNADNNWTYTVSDLLTYQSVYDAENDNLTTALYSYYFKETECIVKGVVLETTYETTDGSGAESLDENGTITITNTVEISTDEYISISGSKTWDDMENAFKTRPETMELTLTASSGDTPALQSDDPDDLYYLEWKIEEGSAVWYYTIGNVPKYDSDKEQILYTVVETLPTGYETDATETTGEVQTDGSIINANFTNTYRPYSSITIVKYDSDGKTVLQGVGFSLYASDGSLVSEKTTDENGKACWTGLEAGTYTVTETSTLDGYQMLTNSFTVTVPLTMTKDEAEAAGTDTTNAVWRTDTNLWYFFDLTYNVTNSEVLDLPETGGNGWFIPVIIGAAILTFIWVAEMICCRRKKQAAGNMEKSIAEKAQSERDAPGH